VRWLAVALAYVGTVVGAGFASGQEIYLFFSRHGQGGTLGILLAALGFWWLGYRALAVGARRTALPGLLARVYPRRAAALMDRLLLLFMGAGLLVVAAAGGALLHDLLGWPAELASAVTLTFVLAVATFGDEGILAANTVLVPFLTLVTLHVAWSAPGTLQGPSTGTWWLSAMLYVSYNLFTGLVVLLALGERLPTPRDRLLAAGVGAGVLGLLALVLHRALLAMPGTPGDLPVLAMADRLGDGWPFWYGLALMAALVTTGIAEAFTIKERAGLRPMWLSLVLWPLTIFGFQRLVAALYPMMGILAILFWWPLLRREAR
jgi:uncharacterized membrane protein YkvI